MCGRASKHGRICHAAVQRAVRHTRDLRAARRRRSRRRRARVRRRGCPSRRRAAAAGRPSTASATKGKLIRLRRLTSTASRSSARDPRLVVEAAPGQRLEAGLEDLQPGPDEARRGVEVGREARQHVVAAAHAAAAVVAHDDQMLDLERDHRILDRRRGAVRAAVRLVGRHQVRDVAVDEEVARLVAEDLGDQHPAVAAGDDHRLGVLVPARPVSAWRAMSSRAAPVLPRAIAGHQARRQRPCMFHRFSPAPNRTRSICAKLPRQFQAHDALRQASPSSLRLYALPPSSRSGDGGTALWVRSFIRSRRARMPELDTSQDHGAAPVARRPALPRGGLGGRLPSHRPARACCRRRSTSGDAAEAQVLASRLASLSEQVGLADFARVARDLGGCLAAGNASRPRSRGRRPAARGWARNAVLGDPLRRPIAPCRRSERPRLDRATLRATGLGYAAVSRARSPGDPPAPRVEPEGFRAGWSGRTRRPARWVGAMGFAAGLGELLCLPAPDGALRGALARLGHARGARRATASRSRLPPRAARRALRARPRGGRRSIAGSRRWAGVLAGYRFDRYREGKPPRAPSSSVPTASIAARLERIAGRPRRWRGAHRHPGARHGARGARGRLRRARRERHGAEVAGHPRRRGAPGGQPADDRGGRRRRRRAAAAARPALGRARTRRRSRWSARASASTPAASTSSRPPSCG